MKIQIIYGTEQGNTLRIVNRLREYLSDHIVKVSHIAELKGNIESGYDLYILSSPTWYGGVLSSDWEEKLEEFSSLDFKGKKFAIFGLGDALMYPDNFCDGIGILARLILRSGGSIVGKWPRRGYEFKKSKGIITKNIFYGLPIDEDSQPELTDSRLENWVEILEINLNK